MAVVERVSIPGALSWHFEHVLLLIGLIPIMYGVGRAYNQASR